jgi:hypothetical protein
MRPKNDTPTVEVPYARERLPPTDDLHGRQDHHRGNQPNPRQLHQIGHLIGPRDRGAQPMQLSLHRRDLLRQMVKSRQILLDPPALGHLQIQVGVWQRFVS